FAEGGDHNDGDMGRLRIAFHAAADFEAADFGHHNVQQNQIGHFAVDDFEGFAGNPVLTHRHLGRLYPICNVGHADLVGLESGEWYAVMLASRLIGGYHKNLGRESFIAPVIWEEGWPVISPGTGKVEACYPAPELPEPPEMSELSELPELSELKPESVPERDDFDDDRLSMQWVFIGTPYNDFYSLKDGKLTLKILPRAMSPELVKISLTMPPEIEKADRTNREDTDKYFSSLSFVGKRQRHITFSIKTKMCFEAATENETAGLAVIQAFNHQFRLERSAEEGAQVIRLVMCTCEFEGLPFLPHFKSVTTQRVLAKAEVSGKDIHLMITASGQDFGFYYGSTGEDMTALYENADGRLVNPEQVGGMVGTLLGMYACSNGIKSENLAEFEWFEYCGTEETYETEIHGL
ncbi:MAG: family 43 glycosylhydrolase, partial [Clostridiales bacterium]|nr:family 43 glycosylhydrolase [Clostridiales bacterium]